MEPILVNTVGQTACADGQAVPLNSVSGMYLLEYIRQQFSQKHGSARSDGYGRESFAPDGKYDCDHKPGCGTCPPCGRVEYGWNCHCRENRIRYVVQKRAYEAVVNFLLNCHKWYDADKVCRAREYEQI